MSLLVDTSVWSLALRRDQPSAMPQVAALAHAIDTGEPIISTGLILQELLQGFIGPKARQLILQYFSAVPLLVPDREDHIGAADLRNRCRRAGVQASTIDALLAQLCIGHDLTLLTTDNDFKHIADHCSLKLWRP